MNNELKGQLLGALFCFLAILMVGAGLWALFSLGSPSMLGYVLLGAALFFFGVRRIFPTEYQPIFVDISEPELVEAMRQARSELSRLQSGVAAGRKKAYVRYALPSTDGHHEHHWGMAHAMSQDSITVSTPKEVGKVGLQSDPRQEIPLDFVEDWMLVSPDGKTEGGYSHFAMAKKYLRAQGYVPRALRTELQRFVDVDIQGLR